MTRILSCDSGGKPGYALLDGYTTAPRRLASGRTLDLPLVIGAWGAFPGLLPKIWDVAVAELQWLHGRDAGKRKAAILTLAPRTGWQLCRMCQWGAAAHAHKPQEWRATLGIQPRITKEVVAARVERALLPVELALITATRLPPYRRIDVYDAIAIGWADYLRPRPWAIPP